MEKMYLCKVCGHIEFSTAPEKCPVCNASRSSYAETPDAVMPAAKEGKEKHVPVLTATDSCGLIPNECRDVHVKVGSVPHPMQTDHWIQWIDVYLDYKFIARYIMDPASLKAAVGLHMKSDQKGMLTAIENCNKHGSWMAEIQI